MECLNNVSLGLGLPHFQHHISNTFFPHLRAIHILVFRGNEALNIH